MSKLFNDLMDVKTWIPGSIDFLEKEIELKKTFYEKAKKMHQDNPTAETTELLEIYQKQIPLLQEQLKLVQEKANRCENPNVDTSILAI